MTRLCRFSHSRCFISCFNFHDVVKSRSERLSSHNISCIVLLPAWFDRWIIRIYHYYTLYFFIIPLLHTCTIYIGRSLLLRIRFFIIPLLHTYGKCIEVQLDQSSAIVRLREVYIKRIPGLPRASIVRVTDGIRPMIHDCIEVQFRNSLYKWNAVM